MIERRPGDDIMGTELRFAYMAMLVFAVLTMIVTMTAAQAQPIVTGPTPYRDYTPMGGGFKNKKKASDKKTDYQTAQDLLGAGRFEEAIPPLLRVVADDPRNDDAWHDLGFANQRLGRFAEAAGHYERALAIKPTRRNTRARLGEVYLALNNVQKAEEQLTELAKVCGGGCEEQQQLQAQVEAYKAAHPKA
jgi:tetratricopeptide (TPR) repeat protein